ncbi:unnamed protein product [Leuciscus chuanchicus]
MDRDRQACSVQTQKEMRKQSREISSLRVVNEEFFRELECRSRRKKDSQDTGRIQALLEQRNTVEDQLDNMRQTQTQMEQEIMNMEKKLVEASGTSQACQTQKAAHTLRNKLHWALIRCSERLTKNSQLKEEVETLHMERAQFQKLHRRREKVLQDVCKEIGEVIDMAATAFNDREEAQTEVAKMKKDFAEYAAEMKELKNAISHEHRLDKFEIAKDKARTAMDEKRRRQCEMEEQRRADAEDEARRADAEDKTFDPLEEVFLQIQRLTGEDHLEMLATHFIQVEDKNFSLCNFVMNQNMEVEMAREQIQEIREEIKQIHMDRVQKEEKIQVELKGLTGLQQECDTQAQDYEAQADDISKTLHLIKTGTDSVFKKIDCDSTQVLDVLGSSSGIEDSNIMKYLSLVEQRTSELLIIQAFINYKDPKKSCDLKEVAQLLLGQKPDVLRRIEILLERPFRPITRFGCDYEAEDCEERRILTHKELHQLALRRVMRKESLRA